MNKYTPKEKMKEKKPKDKQMIHVCFSDDMHPYNCDTPYGGSCIHCERQDTKHHNPRTCALCDPKYDFAKNPYWKKPKSFTLTKITKKSHE